MPVNIMKFILQPFSNSGLRNNIPQASSEATGNAGYDKGFPGVTMANVAAGGIPPFGQDFNGIFYDVTSAIQFIQAGQSFPFSQDLSTSIGGYSIGAIVSDPTNKSILWINGIDGNNAFPSGWTSFRFGDPSETVRGTPRLATANEAIAMNSTGTMIDPSRLGAVFGSWRIRDVFNQRSAGQPYVNTSKSLMIANISGLTSVRGGTAIVIVNGIQVVGSSYFEVGRSISVTAPIPPGATYLVQSGQMSITGWNETAI